VMNFIGGKLDYPPSSLARPFKLSHAMHKLN
jgi:hypothetical protein